jgi:hypothetical protein
MQTPILSLSGDSFKTVCNMLTNNVRDNKGDSFSCTLQGNTDLDRILSGPNVYMQVDEQFWLPGSFTADLSGANVFALSTQGQMDVNGMSSSDTYQIGEPRGEPLAAAAKLPLQQQIVHRNTTVTLKDATVTNGLSTPLSMTLRVPTLCLNQNATTMNALMAPPVWTINSIKVSDSPTFAQ